MDPRDGRIPDRLIAAADHALYDAKKAGRNGFATYDPSPPLAPDTRNAGVVGYGPAQARVSVLTQGPSPGL